MKQPTLPAGWQSPQFLFVFLLIVLVIGISAAVGRYVGLRLASRERVPLETVGDSTPSGLSRLGELLTPPTPTPTPPFLPALPEQKIISGGRHVFQTFNNCGPASLSMALSLYGITVTQDELGQALRPWQNPQGDNDDKSVTFAELARKAEEYEFAVYHRPAGDVALLQQFVAHDMPVLTRTLLTVGDDIGHYRVVKGYDQTKGVLIQDDSLQGANLEYAYQDFLNLWQPFNYEFLVLVPADKRAVAERILGERADEIVAWQRALELAEGAVASAPNDTYAQLNRSVAFYHLGRFSQAVQAFETAEARLPFRALWYQIEPILAYYRLGENERALALIDHILSRENLAYAELHFLRGQILEDSGDTDGAATAFAAAQRYNPTAYWRVNVE